MVKKAIIYLMFSLVLICCKKHEEENHCAPIITFTPSSNSKQFFFKTNSQWIEKNIISGSYDTIKVWGSGLNPTYSAFNGRCKTSETESFAVSLVHTLLPGNWATIEYEGYQSGIEARDKYNGDMGLGFFEKNSGDSILYNNNTTWNKIEAIHPTITINGHSYNNVYEISYHPVWYGFTKIYWCPGVGFVKLEGYNHVTNQPGIWELESYNVSLY
jgi:hypothetical protein